MKKLSLAVIMAALIALTALPVFADSERVVTLGANLTMEEQQKMLRYFGAGENVRIIYVTNDEERAFLSDYIPLSVIGTRTLSCAYVKPTNSGGIQVKTANLNWVTSNMIASALSTAGVKNCEVIAACPREVSGTGALAGVLKAYETASDTELDPALKVIAAQEIATVSSLAEELGQNKATQIVNEVKIEIIEDEVEEADEALIEEIVEEVLARNEEENSLPVTDELKESIEELAKQIAAQNYNYEDVKETLDRVEQNVTNNNNNNPEINININNTQSNDNTQNNTNTAENDAAATDNTTPADENAANDDAALAEDSILTNTNDDALGENIIVDATTEDALPEDYQPIVEAPAAEAPAPEAEFEITTSDEAVVNEGEPAPEDDSAAVEEPVAEAPADTSEDLDIPEAQTDVISEEQPADDLGEEELFEESSEDEALLEDSGESVPDESSDSISEEPADEAALTEDAAPADDAAEEKKAAFEEKFNSNAIKVYSTFKPESVTFSYNYPGDEPGEAKKVEKPVIIELKEENLTDKAKEIGAKYAVYIPTGEITMDCSGTANLDDVTVTGELKYVASGITVSEESKGVYTVTTPMPEGAVSSVVSVNPDGPAAIDDEMFLRFSEDGEATLTVTHYNEAQEEVGSDTLTVASLKAE